MRWDFRLFEIAYVRKYDINLQYYLNGLVSIFDLRWATFENALHVAELSHQQY